MSGLERALAEALQETARRDRAYAILADPDFRTALTKEMASAVIATCERSGWGIYRTRQGPVVDTFDSFAAALVTRLLDGD